MRSRAIVRLTLKIGKNVNKTEIDHISAYLCGHKLSELLIRHYNDRIGHESRNNLYFKVSEKWHLFCFVLTSDFRRATFALLAVFFGSVKTVDVVFTVASSSDFRRATFAVSFGSSADIDVVFTVFAVCDQSIGDFSRQCCTSIRPNNLNFSFLYPSMPLQ